MFLAGPWADAACDPLLWGFDSTPLTHITVKQTTRRLVRLRALAQLASLYSPSQAVSPALLGCGASGAVDPGVVPALADKQRAKFLAHAAAASAAAPRLGSRSQPWQTAAQTTAMLTQPWMLPSPPRPSRAERAQQRQQGQAGPRRPGAKEDTADPLSQTGAGRPVWRAAWGQVHASDRRRHHCAFLWALLHGALPCGAAKVSTWPTGADGLAAVACCGNAACRPAPTADAATQASALETLIHALLDCPAVRPALRWAAGLWGRIEGGGGPPITPQVWLQGDDSAWQPQRASNRPLWHTLRAALLYAAWSLRCRRVDWGTQFTPADVVAACVADLRSIILADWQRATADITRMDGVSSRLFPRRRGRRAEAFGVGEFEEKWCSGGVVAHVARCQGGRHAVEVRLEAPSGEVR